MAAITCNAIRKEHVLGPVRIILATFRKMLDAFVSDRMRYVAAASAEQKRKRVQIPPAEQAQTPAVQFAPLDPSILSDAIPAFFIGRDSAGFWVAREATGRIGGLFLLKSSALSFAREQSRLAGCATIFPTERFELDLENEGNRFALHLAPLMRRIRTFFLCVFAALGAGAILAAIIAVDAAFCLKSLNG
jgi:hypothetical protein